jgi:arylsulfatase A-like enzyme
MKKYLLLTCLGLLSLGALEAKPPNIVFILTDDQGPGDVSALNPDGRIPTPHIDRLAAEGMTFPDAHSSSAVCTPSRYSILTGRYAWRSPLKRGVLMGFSPPLIESGRTTVGSFLQDLGYHTACIGKWHLGMDWAVKADTPNGKPGRRGPAAKHIDFAEPIANGPTTRGFDEFFGISASLDMAPYVYIENDRVTRVPDRDDSFPWILGGDRRTRRGPTAEDFDAADVLGDLTRRAVAYLDERAAEPDKPFFLYFPLASPHTPILPTDDWQGKSGVNYYADFTMETDSSVGEILKALDRHELAEDTIVMFATDNGCSPEADFETLAEAGHHPSGPYRGHKADLFEGGHRVPFFVRWPGNVGAGSSHPHPVGLHDLLATCADVLGRDLPDSAGEDSVSLLPALRGETAEPLRESLVNHSINGSFALRQGKWKLLLCPGSGGWSAPRPRNANDLPPVQLYDLDADPAETTNLSDQHPERVASMTRDLETLVKNGRSTPGEPQSNDGKVDIRRGD